jgi:hypothetical protein
MGFYEILEDEMLRVVEKSKTSRNILGALNSTFVALI